MKKHSMIMIVLLALLVAAGIMPPLAARAEDFTCTITMSGAASGVLPSGTPHYDVMEGQYITFHVVGSEPFELTAHIGAYQGALSYRLTDVSATVKDVTVQPINGADFSGESVLDLNLYRNDDSSSLIARRTISLQAKTFVTTITVTPQSLTLAVGQTYQLHATADPAIDNYGNPIEFNGSSITPREKRSAFRRTVPLQHWRRAAFLSALKARIPRPTIILEPLTKRLSRSSIRFRQHRYPSLSTKALRGFYPEIR